ncbi:MAG: sugar ABC transporter permease [Lachnospiraceae bacterium]|nr:sugar ABC transporter permease [Lachnospiraceae bacterium]
MSNNAKTAALSAGNKETTVAKKANLRRFWHKNWMGYAFMAPFVILFTIFIVAPVITAIGLSFTDYNMMQTPHFVGFNNYKLLFLDDDVFKTALSNTVKFAVITGPTGYLLSFFAAWVINQLKFKRAFALAFYAPSITSGVAMTNVWLVLFSSDRKGYLNYFLMKIGLIDQPILWNTDPKYIMSIVMFIQLWMSMGTGFLVFLAGLQNMDRSIYEAGAIDGVKSKFQELFYLTLPAMKPQLLFGAINTITSAFAVFDIAAAVAGMPSPNYSAHTIVAHLYDYAFIRFQMGYASAIAVVLFLITFILGRIVMKTLSSRDE